MSKHPTFGQRARLESSMFYTAVKRPNTWPLTYILTYIFCFTVDAKIGSKFADVKLEKSFMLLIADKKLLQLKLFPCSLLFRINSAEFGPAFFLQSCLTTR